MNVITWISKKFGKPVSTKGEGWLDDEIFMQLYTEACYRDMAIFTAVDLMARLISKCEFKTFVKKEENKDNPEWYRWNVEANKNQNSNEFIRKLIFTLLYNGECLVVESGGQMLVADSFMRTPYVLHEDLFEQVTIADMTFNRKFHGSEVLYWNLDALGNGKTIQNLVFGVCESYAKLLAYAMKAYQTSRGTKAVFRYDAFPPNVSEQEERNKWLQAQMEKYAKFLSSDSGVTTAGKGINLEAFDRKSTYSNDTTRDIRHLIDDICDFTAKSVGIHPALLRGDVQNIENAMDFTLTVGIDPLVDMLRKEIVRKTIGQSGLAKGYDLVIDTSTVKHIDILDVAPNIEKLIGSGVMCINDILKMMGRPIIDEDWANKHFMTRNYSDIKEFLKTFEGGE